MTGARRISSDPASCGSESLADRAELLASSYYEGGFHCGESVVKAVNEVAGHPLPPEVFRMASGFCEGISGSRCTCGALAGGVMAMGLLGGRESVEDPWQPPWDATADMRERFFEDEGTTLCDTISDRHGGMRHPQRWAHCTELVGKVARWVIEVAQERGMV